MNETQSPTSAIYRIARKPDAWAAPDWARVNSDGTFGNRFDDPEGYYRVLYASSQRLSCFLETLARFRPDLSLVAELQEIEGEDDFIPIGLVPREWCEKRVCGAATADGRYADIYATGWLSTLRKQLASACLKLGLIDLDAGVLQQGIPRAISQLAGREAYKAGLDGVYYRSRYGHDLENWAIFEPFPITVIEPACIISADDPDLLLACNQLQLELTAK
jgi:hypothetical protein